MTRDPDREPSLFQSVAGAELPSLARLNESTWIDVIRKMDEVYGDLIRYEVDLEGKHQALADAHGFISDVLSSMFDVLIVCDAQGRVQQGNKALVELTGTPEHELRKRPLATLFTPANRQAVEDLLARVRQEVVTDCELTLAGKDGNTPLAVNCTPRHDRRNRFTGVVLIGRPVGELRRAYDALNHAHFELKRTQQQLIHSEKLASLGRLVAGVAHELNNPLGVVYSNTHTLRKYAQRLRAYLESARTHAVSGELAARWKELKLDRVVEDLDPLLDETLQGAERAHDIVNNLRRYTTMQRGERTAVGIHAVIESAVHWVKRGAAAKTKIDLDIPGELATMGYESQLHQVAINLIQNGIDAAEKSDDPRITIGAKREGDHIVITFADNGSGIAEEDLPRVFDPFFTTKPVGKGTGLGLSITETIVRDHDGTITVANVPGGGAMFKVSLPAAPPGATAPATPAKPPR